MQATGAPQGVLVRVKRRRDAEPVPELVLEVPTDKRRRVGGLGAAMRLMDTVSAEQWAFHEGLPASWSSAASTEPAKSSADLGLQPPPAPFGLGKEPAFREAGRRLVTGVSGETVQLVDVETRPAKRGAAATPSFLSGFLIDGQPLVSEPTGVPAPAAAEDSDDEGDFVWDVYAPAEAPTGLNYEGFSAYVELTAPVFEDEDWEEVVCDDLRDIDASSSEGEDGWLRPGLGGRAAAADSSSDDGDWYAGPDDPEQRWVDAMD